MTTIAAPAIATKALTRSAVVEAIFKAIARGMVHLGEKVQEQEITDHVVKILQNPYSKTPIREALAVLASDGFVVQRPQVGYWFLPVTSEEIEEVTSLRQGLEATLVQRLSGTSAWPNHVEDAIGRVLEATRRGDFDGVLAADTDVHVPMALAGAPAAAPAIRTWGDKLRVFWATRDWTGFDVHGVAADHQALFSHLRQQDFAAAVNVVEDHLDRLATAPA